MAGVGIVRAMIRHHVWSMERLFAALKGVAEDGVPDDRSVGSRPLQDIVRHLVEADGFWLGTVSGAEVPLGSGEHSADIRSAWGAVQSALSAYAERLVEEDLEGEFDFTGPGFKTVKLTVAEGLLQMLLHAAQHRAEVAVLLTESENSPGPLDLLFSIERLQSGD